MLKIIVNGYIGFSSVKFLKFLFFTLFSIVVSQQHYQPNRFAILLHQEDHLSLAAVQTQKIIAIMTTTQH